MLVILKFGCNEISCLTYPNSMKFTLPAFAKINWFLRILGKRDDGYHQICTAFQTVSLCDEIEFSEADDILLTCDDPTLPIEDNLVLRAARLLRDLFVVKKGAVIHLKKRIPAPGGLAGGSSDAVTTLIGLCRLWNLRLKFTELLEIAQQIGSDAPFFLYGGTCLGVGRGTEIIPVDEIEEKFILIVTPKVSISTAEAYQRLGLPNLTNFDPVDNLKFCYGEIENFKKLSITSNDFEKTIFEMAPEIKQVKKTLLEQGARLAQLSGSGASVFAVFESETTRQTAMRNMKHEWKKFAVTTVSRGIYQEALALRSILIDG